MSATANAASACAACGKSGRLKTCTGCEEVQYCDAKCQKVDRPVHKAYCKERFDERLFAQPPAPFGDCPICSVQLPFSDQTSFLPCCGQVVCTACMMDVHYPLPCPYCNVRYAASAEEFKERMRAAAENNNAEAINELACMYRSGSCNTPQDFAKALELFQRAADLGSVTARNNLGRAYHQGIGVVKDHKKALRHFQIAAMGGEEEARYCLGDLEFMAGNPTRAYKHFQISARAGDRDSMERVHFGWSNGEVAEDEFKETERAFMVATKKMRSPQRDRWLREVRAYQPVNPMARCKANVSPN